jgi:hypothetical protein
MREKNSILSIYQITLCFIWPNNKSYLVWSIYSNCMQWSIGWSDVSRAWYPVIRRLSPSTQRWKSEKVSKTLETNSTLMWLITWKDFNCSNIISGQISEHILSVLKESHITNVCCKNCWIAVFTKQNTLLCCDEIYTSFLFLLVILLNNWLLRTNVS